ncbi:MAG: cob(I)yrinic acid a,c-diamide adenosyltransferase [Candidatus Binatus sp.]
MGHGFTWESLDLDRDREAARRARDIAHSWLLDERALQARRADLRVILTGRDAPAELSAIVDVVTEMQAVKHPYRDGVSA